MNSESSAINQLELANRVNISSVSPNEVAADPQQQQQPHEQQQQFMRSTAVPSSTSAAITTIRVNPYTGASLSHSYRQVPTTSNNASTGMNNNPYHSGSGAGNLNFYNNASSQMVGQSMNTDPQAANIMAGNQNTRDMSISAIEEELRRQVSLGICLLI